MASRFAQPLQTHSVFELPPSLEEGISSAIERVWGDNRDPVDSNVVACSPDFNLFVCDRLNNVKVIDLKAFREDRAAEAKQLVFSPKIKFRIVKLLLNTSGTLLLAIGAYDCAVIELSERVRAQLASAIELDVTCTTHKINSYNLSRGSGCKIEKVMWHPLSHAHVLILTSDNRIRMFNVAHDTEEPEQVFHILDMLLHNVKTLRKEIEAEFAEKRQRVSQSDITHRVKRIFSSQVVNGDANVVSFCFGSTKAGGWYPFTLFVLLDTGEVYYISPVIPYNCPLRFQLIKDLEEETQDMTRLLENSGDPVEPYEFEKLDLRRQWIYEVTGELVTVSMANPTMFDVIPEPDPYFVSDADPQHKFYRSPGGDGDHYDPKRGVRFRTKTLPDIAPLSKKSLFSEEKRAGEFVRTRRPKSIPALKIQGPIEIIRDSQTDFLVSEEVELARTMGSANDVAVTATLPPVLLRSFGCGAVEAMVMCSGVEAAWEDPDIPGGFPQTTDAVFWEGFDLQYHQVDFPPHMPYTPVKIMLDPHHESLAYIYSTRGVHRVDLTWLPRLEEALQREGLNVRLPSTKHSDVDFLLNTHPLRSSLPSAIVGITLVSQPLSGSLEEFLLIVTEDALKSDAQGGGPLLPPPPQSPKSGNVHVSPSRFGIEQGRRTDPVKLYEEKLKKQKQYIATDFVWKAYCLRARRPISALALDSTDDNELEISDDEGSVSSQSSQASYKPPSFPGQLERLTKSLNPEDPEALRRFLSFAKDAREKQGVYASKIQHAAATRLDQMADRIEAQQALLSSIGKKFEVISEHRNLALDKLEVVKATQEMFSRRLVILLGLINSSQRKHSRDEVNFFKEVQDSYYQLADLKAKVDDLKSKAERLAPKEPVAVSLRLTDDQISQFHEFLQAQQESVTKLAEAIRDLTFEAEDLSS